MTLDEQDLREGLKFIVGTWQVDYVVNAFSNDLAHIPASEFKSADGRDFTALKFEFFEDHTVAMLGGDGGAETQGTWEQTGWSQYHYTLNGFLNIPEGSFRDNAEKLEVSDGHLVFAIGFLAIALKKIAEGTVTEHKEPDIGEIVPTAEENAKLDIVGRYEVAQAMAFVDGDFGFHTREEVEADCKRRVAAGEMEEDDVRGQMQSFNTVLEFTPDHKVIGWVKIPVGVTEEQIKEAVESGEIGAVRDGYFTASENEWKFVNGAYYYDSGEHREVFGELKSSWDELKFDEDGLMEFGDGMMKLRKI